jgi:acyl-CoA synthetase (NDP forming)
MTIRNLDFLFKPKSVALIGASKRPGSLGAVVARNLGRRGTKATVVISAGFGAGGSAHGDTRASGWRRS